MSKKEKTLSVVLSAEVVEVLQHLARVHRSSMTQELLNAVTDRKFLSDKHAEGYRLLLERDSEIKLVRFR